MEQMDMDERQQVIFTSDYTTIKSIARPLAIALPSRYSAIELTPPFDKPEWFDLRDTIENHLRMHPKDQLVKWLPDLQSLRIPLKVQRFFPEDMGLLAPRILQIIEEYQPDATWQDLCTYSVWEISKIPEMTAARITGLLRTLIELALRPTTSPRPIPRRKRAEQQHSEPIAATQPASSGALQEVPPGPETFGLTEELTKILAEFSEVEIEILHARVFSSPARATLAELGTAHGVTRERIRQLQARATRTLKAAIGNNGHVLQIAEKLGSELGAAFLIDHPRVAEISRSILGREISAEHQAMMMYLAGPYSSRKGAHWKSDHNLQMPAAQRLDRLITDDGTKEEALIEHLLRHGVREEFALPVLESFGFYTTLGRYFTRRPSAEQLAYVALTNIGRPATIEEIAEVGGFTDMNLRGVRSRLFEDDRFIRRSKDEFALAGWGLTEFSGIVDAISRELEQFDYPVPVKYFVDKLPEKYLVSATSVRAYLEAPLFVIEDSKVRFRQPNEPFKAGGNIHRRPGTFQLGNLLTLHIPINHDAIRGSGIGVAANIVEALGLIPGEPVQFVAENQILPVTWPITALGGSIGSVRGFVLHLDGEHGDTLRLTFDTENHTVKAALIEAAYTDALHGLREYTGFDFESVEEVTSQLPEALGFPEEGIIHALRGRGDGLAADLYEELIRSS